MQSPRKRINTETPGTAGLEGVVAVVPAAGLGRRFGQGTGKSFATLLGKPLLIRTLEALEAARLITEIVLVVREEDLKPTASLLSEHGLSKVSSLAAGGRERQDSVSRGLQQVLGDDRIVLVHDGARPLVSGDVISRALGSFEDCDGLVTAVPLKDTVKEVREEGTAGTADGFLTVVKTVDRSSLWAIQTPQVFRCRTLRDVLERAAREGFYATDDAALVEHYGGRVRVVMGSYRNIKVTTPEDIIIAEALCRAGVGQRGA